MKKLTQRLLKAIEANKDLDTEQKNELLDFIGWSLHTGAIIRNLHAHVFHTRFLSSDEIEMNQAELIKSLLGYNDSDSIFSISIINRAKRAHEFL